MDNDDRIDAQHTIVRLRRLTADGWTPSELRALLGWEAGRVELLVMHRHVARRRGVRLQRRTVSVAEHVAVSDLYRQLRWDEMLVDQLLTGAQVDWCRLDPGDRVRVVGYLRTRRGWNATETALSLGVCVRTVQRWTREYRAGRFANAA